MIQNVKLAYKCLYLWQDLGEWRCSFRFWWVQSGAFWKNKKV